MNSFYTREELPGLGLGGYGEEVLISRRASLYGAASIVLGSHVRIDDFCILSGNIRLGSYIHIAAYTALYGGKSGICVDDFANISSKVAVYAIGDDYSGTAMTNPMIPDRYRGVTDCPVHIGRHVIIGCGSVVLPGACLGEGCAVGAMSLVKERCEPFGIYAGVPATRKKERERGLLEKERQLLEEAKHG